MNTYNSHGCMHFMTKYGHMQYTIPRTMGCYGYYYDYNDESYYKVNIIIHIETDLSKLVMTLSNGVYPGMQIAILENCTLNKQQCRPPYPIPK